MNAASRPEPAAEPPVPAWAATRERSNRIALQFMAWVAMHIGRGVARWLLHPITLYYLVLAPTPRRHSARYLGRALGRPATWRDLYRHIHTFASVVLDRIYFVRGRMDEFDMQHSGGKLVDDSVTAGRGTFLLGAHLGSFESLHAIGATRPGMRVAMVMYPDNARLIHSVLQAVAPDLELSIIPIGRTGSTLAIRDWLDGGGLVGLLGDRVTGTEGPRSGIVEMPFLGVPAPFTDGPLRLAMLLRRRVIFMVGLFRGGKVYDVRFELLADFSEPITDAGERERRLHQALADYVARLEALCREAPYNWFNFYDFWREDLPR